jgi:hypothetical protein
VRSSYYWLLSSVQLGLEKYPYPPVIKVPSPLKAPTRMYVILLFIFIPKGMNRRLLVAVIKL